MPSSISSSEPGRALPASSLGGAALIALITVLSILAGWELYWRAQGVTPSYRNSEGLWAIQRRRIDEGEGDALVITGSSRALFDLQLDVWEQETGQRPIQIALEGTSPLRVMEALAADPHFTGTLLVGVAPGIFFSGFEFRQEVLDRYPQETPSQWLGQRVSMLVEPMLAFYNFDFSLFAVIKRQDWPQRDGVQSRLEVRKLANFGPDRNARLWQKVELDPAYQSLAKQVWADGFVPISQRSEEEIERALKGRSHQLDRALAATRQLQARGVEVIFLRNPAEGHYAISEPMYNPRNETWDVLIEQTGALGIHWRDHQELQGYWLPEWSHLSGREADRYTRSLVHLLEREAAAHHGVAGR